MFFLCTAGLCVFVFTNFPLCRQSVLEATTLFYTNVMPSLFAFFVLSSLLSALGARLLTNRKHNGNIWLLLLVIFLTGSPAGARNVAQALTKEQIDLSQAKALISLCHNTSPIYLYGTAGVVLLQDVHTGIALLFISWIALGLTMVVFFHKTTLSAYIPAGTQTQQSTLSIIVTSIGSGVGSVLSVGAYIVFFYLFITVLNTLQVFHTLSLLLPVGMRQAGRFFMMGLVEMTAPGAYVVQSALSLGAKRFIIAFCSLLGGISISMQSLFFISEHKSLLRRFWISKGFYCLFCLLLTLCWLNLS